MLCIRSPDMMEPVEVLQPAEAGPTVVNAKKALTVLQRGVNIVRRAVDGSTHVGAGYNEVERLAELSQRITWAYTVGDGVYAADGSTATSDVQVAVVDGAPPASLNQDAIFQAHQGYDGFPRIYVLPRRCTATWAAYCSFTSSAMCSSTWKELRRCDPRATTGGTQRLAPTTGTR